MNLPDAHVTTRRTGGRSARVRAAVLQATIDALLADGVEALSVADVAHRAGVHETSIYRRWGTKANLALDAVLSQVRVDVPAPDTGSLRGDLTALLHGIAAFMRTPLGETLVRMAVRDDLPEYEAAREAFWTARFTLGSQILDRARTRGELREGVDPRTVLETLVGPLSLRFLLTREPLDDQFLRRTVDLVLHGILPGASGSNGPEGSGPPDP